MLPKEPCTRDRLASLILESSVLALARGTPLIVFMTGVYSRGQIKDMVEGSEISATEPGQVSSGRLVFPKGSLMTEQYFLECLLGGRYNDLASKCWFL